MIFSLGWTWSWPAADYGMFGFEPENTDTSRMPTETNGYYLDWHAEDSDASRKAQEAWEQVEANPEPEEGQEARNEAYIEMEEAIWDDAIMLPLYHDTREQFAYDHVDIEPFGAMGDYQQRYNSVTLE
ncbi:family 5 extracellular solute-binding protein [Natrialba taiwanensis DSM 12281]|uniref:Family 5 extracellular solute-binding protein n=1 Tax=Natrialba taiwanensis DSM 12281 TaxID=1230458 RepID=M0A1F8_9EURY|nr:family 5 extracellular solute-binding protein [Natrialba taiwanensis DSM 12281]